MNNNGERFKENKKKWDLACNLAVWGGKLRKTWQETNFVKVFHIISPEAYLNTLEY